MSQTNRSEFSLQNRVSVWVATGLGVGCASPAPGTMGGLWGIPLAWALAHLPSTGWQCAAILVILGVSVVICNHAAGLLGRKDPPEIVLDEIAALPIVFLGTGIGNWRVLLAGWFLFRLFDISKPPPARQVESCPAGWGIMADDVVAAIYACAVLWSLAWLDSRMGWGLITAAAAG
ncbi:phosphatidylglycerophosphatase A family protein [Bythopirellula polymerisocia]|uniref:Phosphatidylglycerophosphatase A n=1 Tax=Bythopirellula polymerisocia TaxID=2528003 RepID=A0A5C6D4B0_9BACT|nr:phosphatidylglycerophosphatase A [Bythopirellula polymerisocia]TWU30086.1 Phosphatidylglycerophosphatase A [Bythopirellula polymerisocia]